MYAYLKQGFIMFKKYLIILAVLSFTACTNKKSSEVSETKEVVHLQLIKSFKKRNTVRDGDIALGALRRLQKSGMNTALKDKEVKDMLSRYDLVLLLQSLEMQLECLRGRRYHEVMNELDALNIDCSKEVYNEVLRNCVDFIRSKLEFKNQAKAAVKDEKFMDMLNFNEQLRFSINSMDWIGKAMEEGSEPVYEGTNVDGRPGRTYVIDTGNDGAHLRHILQDYL